LAGTDLELKLNYKYFPYIVIALALLTRLIYFFQYAGTPFYAVPMWDAGEYHDMAVALSKGSLHPSFAFRPPLYPILLGLVYMLFGVGPLVPSLLQIAGGVYACVLVQRITTRLFGEWAGLGAGLTAAMTGMMVFYDLELMPTSLEVILMLLLMNELIGFDDNKELESWKVGKSERGDPPLPPPASRGGKQSAEFASRGGMNIDSSANSLRGKPSDIHLATSVRAGLWFALSVMARSVMLPLLPVIIFWMWWMKTGWKKILTFTAIGLSSLFVTMVLNLLAGNGALLTPAQGGVNFYIGNRHGADGFTATLPNVGAGWGWDTVTKIAGKAEGRSLTPKEVDNYYWQAGWHEITSDPLGWAKLMIRKTWLFWNHLEISNDRDIYYHAHRYPIIGWLLGIGVSLFFPLALVGIWVYFQDRRVMVIYLILLIYQEVVVFFFVNGRFRHPLTPLLIILAAGGVKWIAEIVSKKDFRLNWDTVGAGAMMLVGVFSLFAVDSGINPKRWDYGYFTEATALEKMGEVDQAEILYRKALETNPRAPFVNFNLGNIERNRSHIEKAAEYYYNEVAIQPYYGKAWNNLGLMAQAAGDFDRALECFEEALRVRPDLTESAVNAAQAWSRRGEQAKLDGDEELARRSFDRVAELRKGTSVARD